MGRVIRSSAFSLMQWLQCVARRDLTIKSWESWNLFFDITRLNVLTTLSLWTLWLVGYVIYPPVWTCIVLSDMHSHFGSQHWIIKSWGSRNMSFNITWLNVLTMLLYEFYDLLVMLFILLFELSICDMHVVCSPGIDLLVLFECISYLFLFIMHFIT